jgi:hypothetical protein
MEEYQSHCSVVAEDDCVPEVFAYAHMHTAEVKMAYWHGAGAHAEHSRD